MNGQACPLCLIAWHEPTVAQAIPARGRCSLRHRRLTTAVVGLTTFLEWCPVAFRHRGPCPALSGINCGSGPLVLPCSAGQVPDAGWRPRRVCSPLTIAAALLCLLCRLMAPVPRPADNVEAGSAGRAHQARLAASGMPSGQCGGPVSATCRYRAGVRACEHHD